MLRIRNELPEPETSEWAEQLQTKYARKLNLGHQTKMAAGVDIAFSRDDERAYVVAVVLSMTNWRPIAEQRVRLPVSRPYERGMLGWRRAPLMLEALTKLHLVPDFVMVHGDGLAHPRKFGTACHVGYALDHPTIGISKIWPLGCLDTPATMTKRRGDKRALVHEVSKDVLGYEVYTQINEDPIFVSPGHRLSIESAVSLTLRCAPRYRMPEPLLVATEAAEKFRDEEEAAAK